MSFVETMIPWRGHLKFRIYNSRGGGKKIKNNKKNPRIWSAGDNGLHRKIRLYLQHGNIRSFGAHSRSKHHQYI